MTTFYYQRRCAPTGWPPCPGIAGRLPSELPAAFGRNQWPESPEWAHNAEKPIFLIVDGHPTHKAGKVRKFVESTEGRLRLFILPPYSPELNPSELVWNNLKNHRVGRKTITGPDDLKHKVMSGLRSLQKMPAKIIGFFHEKHTRYAMVDMSGA